MHHITPYHMYHPTLYHTCCHIAGSISRLCRMLSNAGSSLPPASYLLRPHWQGSEMFQPKKFGSESGNCTFLNRVLSWEERKEGSYCLVIFSAAPKDSYDRSSIALTNQLETWPGQSNDIGKLTSPWSVLKSQLPKRGCHHRLSWCKSKVVGSGCDTKWRRV